MLKQCTECGKFFGADSANQTLCTECSAPEGLSGVHGLTLEEKKYELARSIVYDFPEISPEELIKKMAEKDVELRLKEIMGYVREGKMELKDVEGGVFCEGCGKKIISGRLCPKCTHKFEQAIQSHQKSPEEKEEKPTSSKNRMYSRE